MIFTRLQRFNGRGASSFLPVLTLREELDNLFQQAVGQPLETQESGLPSLDLYEDQAGVVVKIELPGMKKEDIAISLQDGVLTVSGERKQDPKLEGATVCRCERVLGRFERRVSLPSQVDADKIKAVYADGVLTVTVPKSEEAKPKQIPIDIK
jgi:HSP20 family protein